MKTRHVILAFALVLVLATSTISAFVLFNPPVKWASGDLPRNIAIRDGGHGSVDDADGGVTEIVDAVASSWNQEVPGNLTTTSVESNPPASVGDGISTMHFNVIGTGCSGSCLAVTIAPIPPSSPNETVNGTVFALQTDSDVFFNPSGKFYSDSESDGCKREYHIESVAVHEVGHLLGLDHTPDTSATMYAFTDKCDTSPVTLEQDDIDGINCIYNNGYGCGGCVADTLVVDRTECSQPTRGKNKGDFVVDAYIVDNCGGVATGATVRIDVDAPDGPLFCEGDTNSQGRLSCVRDNPVPGPYTSTVTSVSKSGFSWPGSECGGVNDPCSCSMTVN